MKRTITAVLTLFSFIIFIFFDYPLLLNNIIYIQQGEIFTWKISPRIELQPHGEKSIYLIITLDSKDFGVLNRIIRALSQENSTALVKPYLTGKLALTVWEASTSWHYWGPKKASLKPLNTIVLCWSEGFQESCSSRLDSINVIRRHIWRWKLYYTHLLLMSIKIIVLYMR